MSLLPGLTYSAPGVPIYGGGGGGGGGGSTITTSTISASTGFFSTITMEGDGVNTGLFMEGNSIQMTTNAETAAIGGAGFAWNPVTSNLIIQTPSTCQLSLQTDKGNGVFITDDEITVNRPLYGDAGIYTGVLTLSSLNTANLTMNINPIGTDLIPKRIDGPTSQYVPPTGQLICATFSTVPGCVYEIGCPYFVTAVQPVAAPSAGAALTIAVDTTPIAYLDTFDLASVSTVANDFRCCRNYTFIANANGHNLLANNTATNVSSLAEFGQKIWIKNIGFSNTIPSANDSV
jgi:hypothetical protein